MIRKKVILNLNGMEYEILQYNYSFKRQIDSKGRPSTGIQGGDIWVDMESNEECPILRQMVLKSVPPVIGYIELLEGGDERCIRRIKFDKAYVCDYSEILQTRSASPMHTRFRISPIRLDVGDKIKLDRRWPDTIGFHWQELKEEKKPNTKSEPIIVPAKDPIITRIYWKDEDGNEITNLPEKGIVVLCAETLNTNDGDKIEFNIDLADGNTIKVSGELNNKGQVEIPNINLSYEPE